MTWKEFWRSTALGTTSQRHSERPGSRSRTGITRRWQDGRNCSTGSTKYARNGEPSYLLTPRRFSTSNLPQNQTDCAGAFMLSLCGPRASRSCRSTPGRGSGSVSNLPRRHAEPAKHLARSGLALWRHCSDAPKIPSTSLRAGIRQAHITKVYVHDVLHRTATSFWLQLKVDPKRSSN
jgi:hypothetical protein